MEYFAGIDVSLEQSSVCVMDGSGEILREAKVSSDPERLCGFLRGLGVAVRRVGLEAGPLSQWLHGGLRGAGFETVLLETYHVKSALSAMPVKTDKKDARGIAHLLRTGWYRAVHVKSPACQEIRALLVARKQLQGTLLGLENSLRGILRGFGLKVGRVTRKTYDRRVRELVAGHGMLEQIAGSMLQARASVLAEFDRLHKAMLQIARRDPVCGRLMTVPGVGALVAISYRTAVDDPRRIAKSKSAGPLFGLTPRKYQSGEVDRNGRISKVGDEMVRSLLYEAATVMLTRATKFSALKHWALAVAKRRGMKRAKVALARKLAVVLHRMWMDGTSFRWSTAESLTA